MNKTERSTLSVVKLLMRFIFSSITIVIQGAIFYILFIDLQKYQMIYYLMEILAIVMVFRIVNDDANNSYKLSWIIIILLLPFIGVLFYLTYGKGRSLPKRKIKKINAYLKDKIPTNNNLDELYNLDYRYHKMATLLHKSSKYPVYKNTQTDFFSDGKEMFDMMIQDMKKAEKYIFMEYFIIRNGEMWDELKDVIYEKAAEGVEIKILYDDLGSKDGFLFSKLSKIKNYPNIMMVPYNPLGHNLSLSVNYRDHRKLTIIDGLICYCGGINIADEYIHKKERFGFWRDNGLRIIGCAVKSNIVLFADNWYMSTKEMLNIENYFGEYEEVLENGYVFPFGDGPSSSEKPAYNLFQSMFDNACETIYISTPYFIIDKEFIDSIVMAINSGVDVRILVPHIPDKKSVFLLTKAHYREILKAGGKVYEYTKGFNHAKNIIVDNKYAFIGTANIDYRSLFLHFECGNFLIETDCIKKMNSDFIKTINESKEIEYEKWSKRSIFTKIKETILAIIAPLM